MITTGGHKTALDLAVAAAREAENQAGEAQGELFGPAGDGGGTARSDGPSQAAALPAAGRGPGRPIGARNKRTDELARYYTGRYGDPLERGIAIAALPILSPDVLEGLAKRLGCERFDAAKWWSGVLAAVLPYTHNRLATLNLRIPGSPDGEPLSFAFADDGVLTIDEAIEAEPEAAEILD